MSDQGGTGFRGTAVPSRGWLGLTRLRPPRIPIALARTLPLADPRGGLSALSIDPRSIQGYATASPIMKAILERLNGVRWIGAGRWQTTGRRGIDDGAEFADGWRGAEVVVQETVGALSRTDHGDSSGVRCVRVLDEDFDSLIAVVLEGVATRGRGLERDVPA